MNNKENEAHQTPKKRKRGFDDPQTPVGLQNSAKVVCRSILEELQNKSSPPPQMKKCRGVNKRKRSWCSFRQVTKRVAMNASQKAANKELAKEFRNHPYGKSINA